MAVDVEEINICVRPKKISGITGDEVLKYTQEARLSMAADMTRDGVPQGRDRRVFLELLTSLDGQVLDSKRLDQESDAANKDQEIARMAIEIQEKRRKLDQKLLDKGLAVVANREGLPAVNEADLPEVTHNEEEFDNTVIDDNYDNFTSRFVESQSDEGQS